MGVGRLYSEIPNKDLGRPPPFPVHDEMDTHPLPPSQTMWYSSSRCITYHSRRSQPSKPDENHRVESCALKNGFRFSYGRWEAPFFD